MSAQVRLDERVTAEMIPSWRAERSNVGEWPRAQTPRWSSRLECECPELCSIDHEHE